MAKCSGDNTDTFLHVLIWFPIAYILAWGLIVMHRRVQKRRQHAEEIGSSIDEFSAPLHRFTTGPFLDQPEKPENPEDLMPSRLSMPDVHTSYCLGPKTYQFAVLALQLVASLVSFTTGVLVLRDRPSQFDSPEYVGVIQLLMGFVWAWCTAVLYIAPASASCSVPIFWTLVFYAHFGSFVSGCGMSSSLSHEETIKVLEMISLGVVVVLVLLSWRNFLGINFIPVLLLIVLFQLLYSFVRRCYHKHCSDDQSSYPIPEGYTAPLIQNEEELLDDSETTVELLVYDLWPSWLPVYVGSYLGAYHTGIAANNKNARTGPLEYTFECPHGVVARKRGKKPSYVQGTNCVAIYLGKAPKALFNQKIARLRESERFSQGDRYGILSNNCHDFCNQLIQELELTVQVPTYAQFLDQLVGFFVPGGSLQSLERFIISLEGPCETRTIWTLAVGVGLFLFCVVVPATIVAIVES